MTLTFNLIILQKVVFHKTEKNEKVGQIWPGKTETPTETSISEDLKSIFKKPIRSERRLFSFSS